MTLQEDAERLRQAWRELMLEYARALRLDKFVAWLAKRLDP